MKQDFMLEVLELERERELEVDMLEMLEVLEVRGS